MAAITLTDRGLKSIPPGGEARDLLMPGLVARRRQKSLVFYLDVMRDGRRHKPRLGTYPVMGLADAREAARCAILAIEAGSPVAPAATFGAGIKLYLRHVESRAKDPGQVRWLFDRFVTPTLGGIPLAKLHRRDLQALVDGIAEGRAKVEGEPLSRSGTPATARRVGAMLAAACNWLHQRGHVENHPFPGGLDRPPANPARERVLTSDEIRAVWKACEGREPSGRLIRLLLLTLCRRDEIGELRPSEIERNAEGLPTAIRLPPSRTKASREHLLPLPPLAAQLVAETPRTEGKAWFQARYADAPFCGWSRAVADIQRISGTSHWSPHDLRRTGASGIAALGARPDIVDRLLNHAPPKLRRTYDRHDYQPELLDFLTRWEQRVREIVAKPARPNPGGFK